MEPLTAGAIAIATVIATKALEKTGEKVGETLWDKTGQFLITVTTCNTNRSNLQSRDFQTRINCNYNYASARINCN
ncbi:MULTISPECIES: hypothetical protein [Nostoc]|uniref:hypothetical protein n=1 Tax=Nostoc TaxID=1177 RepID=UPI001683117C|nr:MULTISPECIES: hypothetical protein [Nostoc]MBD2682301.1 hypothetical protein [Nostoc sp. FACHB-857]